MNAAPVPTKEARTGCGGFTDDTENLSTTCRQRNSLFSESLSPRKVTEILSEDEANSNAIPISDCVGHMTPAEQRYIKDAARRFYSTEEVRRDLRRPLPPDQSEEFDDVILLAAFLLTGHIRDLSAALEWFGERIAIDHPDSLSPLHVVPFMPSQDDHQKTPKAGQPIHFRKIPHVPIGKNTDNVPSEKKTPTMVGEKTLTMVVKKTPTYTIPVVLWVVVSYGNLKEMLLEHNQGEWTSPVRRLGLLILLDFIYRKTKGNTSKGVLVSHDLASDYVSEFNRPKSPTTLRQPLAVLVKLGILEIEEKYKCGPYQRQSTRYRLDPALRKKAVQQTVMLTPKLAEKRRLAPERQQKRLNKKHPWREQLVHDIGTVGLTQEGLTLSIELLADDNLVKSIKRMHGVLSNRRKARAGVDSFGTVLTDIQNFPRSLKPHLTLTGSNVALCDISHAHWCLLPLLLEKGVQDPHDARCGDQGMDAVLDERKRLQTYLSEGDLYRKLSTNPDSDEERVKTKKDMLTALNLKNTWTSRCSSYQKMKGMFPLTFAALEKIKREDHKAITPFLRANTADIIRQSLLRCQELRIPAIPDSDCLICPEEHRTTVCRLIGDEMYRHTGVQCREGDIRFKHPH